MSCNTQNQQPSMFVVTMGSLPEGFCGTPQELGNAIAARLIVTGGQNMSSFVSGPTAPTSNVGPWFKNCEEWWYWNDSLGQYVPLTKGGFNQVTLLDVSGTFLVPGGIYKLKIEMWGGGGGGGGRSTSYSGGGGGGGGYGMKIFSVSPNDIITITVGTGGGGGADGVAGTAGAASTVTINGVTMTVGAGTGGGLGTSSGSTGGTGGAVTGADISIAGQSGGCANNMSDGPDMSASGGDSPNGGAGGRSVYVAGNNLGIVPGGGGAAGTNNGSILTGAAGAHGRCVISY